ncbi:GDP-mannose mannosyl hydrolase [Alteromonas halophila]|uniref:GDP-mannose mannosyl hydrolase n=1 Tax=Alteromonas halophila TaxID=516698 RepID=A0A918MYL4_9ALTE|nr:GDP-mannose mannosyl hydrolase [Alteromonas halophila]GGW82318.1 GDP-mannose mannosyl hydrolase [Alteromonas halophila]
MFLDKQTFTAVIDSTPLVSIDLVVEDERGDVLLGERANRPAKGFWFVPGGRIMKNERLTDAFERLTRDELGLSVSLAQAELIGPFEHFYSDYVFGEDVTTHYVVLGYRIKVKRANLALPTEQHARYHWFTVSELMQSKDVHLHSKWYFDSARTE